MKFGKRLLTELPAQLAPYALDYATLKKHIKEQVGLADVAGGLESGESSMAESAGELNSLEDALAGGPSPLRDVLPAATPAQAAAYSDALRDALARPAGHAEAVAAQISAALLELPQRAGPDEDERLQPLLEAVEELHAFVVLNYIALFKLVKKYNKATRAVPGGPAAVAVLPLLLASPLFHSRPLQLLFQRTAKWRHEGSQHGGNAALGAAGSFGGVASPIKSSSFGGALAAAGSAPPLSPLKLRAGVPIFGGRPGGGGGGLTAFSETFGSSGSLTGEGGSAHGGSAAGAVRCEGCIRAHTRFVVLSCCHTFCWGCLAATLVRQRKMAERQASGGTAALLSLPSSGPAAAAQPPPPPPPPLAPLPPNAGLLARRLSAGAGEGGGWGPTQPPGGAPPSAPGTPSAAPQLECPVCDAPADLETGHLEVNAMLGDASYVWLLTPADGERCNRRILSRSRLAGMDFASLSVYGSPATMGGRGSGGALSSLASAAEGDSPGGGRGAVPSTAPAGVGGAWPKMGRVPSWGSLNATLGGARQS